MMKLGCIGALTGRGNHFIRDLVVEGGFLASGHKEGTWAEGTTPTPTGQRVPRSQPNSPTLAQGPKQLLNAVTWRNYLAGMWDKSFSSP